MAKALGDQYFTDQFQFVDEVHGRILLNNLERDAVDTPEFQRLFRIAQLGLVEITYQTGNHTRGAHSIGTCHAAQRLLVALQQNLERGAYSEPIISPAEKVLIRLGALLHDIPHGPFSHDIEKKKHLLRRFRPAIKIKSANGPFQKHDDYKENPAFYIAVFDTERSILARVLRAYSPAFWTLLVEGQPGLGPPAHIQRFLQVAAGWPAVGKEILPQLLFHLFAFEELADASSHTFEIRQTFDGPTTPWHLGPSDLAKELHEAWYQPFRHEIIGNTLSADLIDYLARDCARLHINGGIDDNLLRYYVLTAATPEPKRFRCAIDLYDHKRGIVRSDRLNDIFQMLEVRHQIHEKAVYHRMAQSSLAMLSRAVTLGQAAEKARTAEGLPHDGAELLTAASLYGFETETLTPPARGDVAMRGDEHFLSRLIAHIHAPTRQLARKLAERRLFRPLMIVPGHRAGWMMTSSFNTKDKAEREDNLREVATIVDSPAFAPFFNVISAAIEGLLRHEFTSASINTSAPMLDGSVELFLRQFSTADAALRVPASYRVLFWTLPYKQLFKDPAIVVTTPDSVPRSLHEIHDLTTDTETRNHEFDLIRERVVSGIADADIRYAQMWKIYVFLSDGLFYGGSIAKLVQDADDYASGCADGGENHASHLSIAGMLAARAISAAWDYWDHHLRGDGDSEAVEKFLTGPPSDHMMRKMINDVLESRASGAGASEVRFEQYQHGEGTTQTRCRDIRYRFEEAAAVPSDHALAPLLEAISCERRFFPSELSELCATLQVDERLVRDVKAASNQKQIDLLLRERAFQSRLRTCGVSDLGVRSEGRSSLAIAGAAHGTSGAPEQVHAFGHVHLFGDLVMQAEALLERANVAARERRVHVALRDVTEILRETDQNPALARYRSQAHLLRAKLALDEQRTTAKSDFREIEFDLTAAETLDRDGTAAEINRLRGIIAWRRKAALFAEKHPRAGAMPLEVTKRGEQATLEEQDRFFAAAAAVWHERRAGNVRQRTVAEEEWNAIAEEAWIT